jgi:peptidoglycan hydrolase-like protein with peptidoglycan-binding domain
MPYKQSIENSDLKGYLGGAESFWALQENVGYGYRNHHMDVRLVQFFLNCAAKTKILKTDGSFGGKTWRAIKDFQKKFGNVQDGMVSAAQGDTFSSPNQHRIYTIYELNIDYNLAYPSFYEDLKMDPRLPPELCSHFSPFDFED